MAGSLAYIMLASSASAASAPDGESPQRPAARVSESSTPLWAALQTPKTTAELLALKEKYSSEPASATAPAGSAAKQATWVAAGDLLEMSAYDGVITTAISRTASPSAFAAAKKKVDSARGRAAVVVKRSELTKEELFAKKVRLVELHDTYANPNETMTFAFDAAKDAVVVRGNLSASLAARIKSMDHVQVEVDPSVPVTRNQGGRYADAPPWHFGGAYIKNIRDHGNCTSGFTMQNPPPVGHVQYTVTAGHCGQTGDGIDAGGGNYYGQVEVRAPYPTWDLAKIRCCAIQYGRDYWVSANTTRRQSNAWTPGVGRPEAGGVCHNGAVGNFEHCDMDVNSTSSTLCDNDGCTSGLLEYSRTNGVQNAWGGDSGMAVYSVWYGAMHIHGVHVGNAGHRNFAEKYGEVLGLWEGQLRTW